jgi:hypothetical protein
MTRLPDTFLEDRALRDAARAVLTEDIARLRDSLGEEGIAARVSSGMTTTISSRIRTGARDVLAQAKAQAADNQGVLAVLIGAIILFLARGTILDWIDDLAAGGDDEDPTDEVTAAHDSDPEPEPAFEGDAA